MTSGMDEACEDVLILTVTAKKSFRTTVRAAAKTNSSRIMDINLMGIMSATASKVIELSDSKASLVL